MAYTERFMNALQYAARLHAKQTRKNSYSPPYFGHLLGTASIVIEHGGDEDEAIGAVLHDGPEDQGGERTLEEIKGMFGDRVALIVSECTDCWVKPKPKWRERKEKYIAHLGEVSPSGLLVSASDKLYNARCIIEDVRVLGPEAFEIFTGKQDGTMWYYEALVEAYNKAPKIEHRTTRIVKELSETIKAIKHVLLSQYGADPYKGYKA